ncbi:YxeA family protein [Lacticaseibacillus pantheris]|uniref:YxeA family protein n=1 Tax=Lacticaseibacillus pantheris TaxID=171523 RepID=UPI002658502E|nr:YxeA family protein [Lacticaseibacillus pantheris]WKF85279.1 YxeA family protein [Lacticaseibacillus pantheris]
MRRFISIILGIAVVIALVGVGAKFATQNSSSQLAATVDQLNPLVGKDVAYVKTTKPVSVNGYGTPTYRQMAVDRYGRSRTLEFVGVKVLKRGRYLKIDHKGAYVETYTAVSASSVPAAARNELQ